MLETMTRSVAACVAVTLAGSVMFLGGCDQGDYASNTPEIKETSTTPSPDESKPSVDEDATEVKPTLASDSGETIKSALKGEAAEKSKSTRTKPSGFTDVDPNSFPVKVTPLVLDLGEIPAGDTGRGKIRVHNTGAEPVLLTQCKTSCGCTTTNCPRGKELLPDEEVEIDISLRGGTVARSLSKKVSLIFDEDKKLDVTVRGEAVTFVEIDPKILDPERHLDGRLVIRSLDDKPFRIQSMVPALIEPDAFSTDPLVEHVVYIDWEKWEELGRNRKLTFNLDHPKANRVLGTVRWYPQAASKPGDTTASPRTITPPAAPAVERLIKSGDIDALAKQLDEGKVELKTTDRSGSSLLALAAKHGQVEVVKMLLERGANLDATDQMGRTPMMTATRAKNPEIIRTLLDAGAAVEPQDMLGSSALSWAAGFGDPESVDMLIEAGSNLEVSGSPTGFTPLIWAAAFGEAESVKALVDAGANIKATDLTHKMTPLMHASRTGNAQKIVALVAAGSDLEARDSSGKTALLVAAGASGATADMVEALIDAGASLSATDSAGRDAVALARQRTDPNADKVIALLESKMSSGDN